MSDKSSYGTKAGSVTWATNNTANIITPMGPMPIQGLDGYLKEMQDKIDRLEKKIQELEVMINIEKMVE